MLKEIAEDPSIDIDTLKIDEEPDNSTSIVLENKVIVTIAEADAKAAREDRQELAKQYLEEIQSSIE
jgi:hypothetical protein